MEIFYVSKESTVNMFEMFTEKGKYIKETEGMTMKSVMF
jgi:hypothetical protein